MGRRDEIDPEPEARGLDDRARLAACLTQRAAIRSVARGQIVDATPEAEEALRLAREIGEPLPLAQTLLFLGGLLQWRAEFDRSLALLHEGVELAERLHAGHLIADGAFFIGNINAAKGEYEEALRWYQRLSDYASAAGSNFWMARVPNTVAGVHLELFDLDEALRLNLEGDEAAQRLFSWPEPRGHSLVKAGLAHLYRSEHGHAEACFRRAEDLLEKDIWMRWRWQVALLGGRAELALAEGRHDYAWACANRSLDLAMQSGSRKHTVRAQRLQGEILAANGKLDEAAQKLTASVRLTDELQTPREAWLGRAALGKVLARLGREKEAEAQFTQAIQTIEALAAELRTPRLRRSFLGAAAVTEVFEAAGRRPPSGA